MHANITNTSRAAQGVWTTDGLRFLQPGETRPLTIAADYVDRVERLPFLVVKQADPLDHDGDGRPGGVKDGSALTPDEEAELVGAMTDDELRDYIERKTGKAPHPRTGHDKLVTLATEAAKG